MQTMHELQWVNVMNLRPFCHPHTLKTTLLWSDMESSNGAKDGRDKMVSPTNFSEQEIDISVVKIVDLSV